MNEKDAFLVLNMLAKIGPVTVIRLLKEYGSAAAILKEKPATLELFPADGEHFHKGDSPLVLIRNWQNRINLSRELKLIEKNDIDILTLKCSSYPGLLKEIPDPPIVLYIKGHHQVFQNDFLSIVGSRKTSDYGVQTASKIATSLALNGIGVISGGARGIDTAAHWATVHANGISICVLGHGMGQTYPAENEALYGKLAEKGAVITQFPYDRKGDRQTFPIRNRIVAGLTMGTIVVEASLASGAMITAQMALDYNREVYAVPGTYGSTNSQGCHQLIRDGATLLDSMEPIIQNSRQLFPNSTKISISQKPQKTAQKMVSNENSFRFIESSLEPNQQCILKILGPNPIQLDQIVQQSQLPVPIVQVALLKLEMLDLITSHAGNNFSQNFK